MADVNYQSPMQLMELLGLRGWENAQPRVYWGLRRPDGLPLDWYAPNAGLGGAGSGSWGGGYQGGYGNVTGGGGGFNSAGVFSAPLSAGPSAAAARFAPSGPESGPGMSDLGAQSQTPGSGLNAQSGSFGDFLGSLATGPVTGLLGVLGQAAYNGITGQPGKPITGTMPFSLASLLGLGSGEQGTAVGAFDGPGGRATGAVDTFGGVSDLDMSAFSGDAGYQGGGGDPGPSPGDPTGGEGPANLYKGGPVTLDKLAGPNPPGPDDGVAYLDVGEHVFTAEEVRKMGGHGAVMKLRDLIRRS